MTDAYTEFCRFADGVIGADSRDFQRMLAENRWLLDVVKTRFPAFTATGVNIRTLREILPILGALRGFAPDGTAQFELDCERAMEERPNYTQFERFLELQGLDPGALLETLRSRCNVQEVSGQLVCTDDDDVDFCDYYDQFMIDADAQEVHVDSGSRATEQWSEVARDLHAFFCDVSDTWYDDRCFTRAATTDGLTICAEYAEQWDYYRTRDGVYRYSEDDEEDNDGIPEYHDAARNWNYRVSNASTRGYFGFEIEFDLPDYEARRDTWQALFSGRCTDFTAERDGSLDEDCGLEVITRPFSMHELLSDTSKLRRLIRTLVNDHGATTGDCEYGVHVTTNIGRLPDAHQERFRHFICANQTLSEFVGRRKQNEYCMYSWGWDEKHSAVARRSMNPEAVEVRIFRSTLDYDVLLSYAQYIEAVIDWTRDPQHLTHGALATSLFRHWVCLSGQYPHLAARFPRQTAKEIHPCVLPSSNRPVEFSRKSCSSAASSITRMGAASLTWT